MLDTLVGQLFLLAIALVSASGGLYAAWVSRRNQDAAASKTDAEAEQVGDTTWITRLDALTRDLGRLQVLSDERFERLVEIERLITDHVSWDFAMVRECRRRGWEVEDPPSLVYVKKKLQEEKSAVRREQIGSEDKGTHPHDRAS